MLQIQSLRSRALRSVQEGPLQSSWRSVSLIALMLMFLTLFVSSILPAPDRLMVDFTQYYDASRALLEGGSPYEAAARRNSPAPYVMPPIFAIVLTPLATMPVHAANVVWFLLSIGFLVVACLGVLRLVRTPAQLDGHALEAPAAILLIAFLLLPVWTGARLGQITALLFCLSIAGLVLRQNGWPVLGGVLLGIAVAFKFIPAALAVFGFWVGWRRFALSAFATFLVLQGVSAILYPATFIEYWTAAIFTIPMHSRGVNLSLLGLVGRHGGEFATVSRMIVGALSLAMLAAPFLLTLRGRSDRTKDRSLEVVLLLCATVTAAPLVEHHYMLALILPIWMLFSVYGRYQSIGSLLLLGTAFFLLSQAYRVSRFVLMLVPAGGNPEVLGEMLLTAGAVLVYVLALVAVFKHRSTDIAPAPLVVRSDRSLA